MNVLVIYSYTVFRTKSRYQEWELIVDMSQKFGTVLLRVYPFSAMQISTGTKSINRSSQVFITVFTRAHRQMNLSHILTFYFIKIRIVLILPSTPSLPKYRMC